MTFCLFDNKALKVQKIISLHTNVCMWYYLMVSIILSHSDCVPPSPCQVTMGMLDITDLVHDNTNNTNREKEDLLSNMLNAVLMFIFYRDCNRYVFILTLFLYRRINFNPADKKLTTEGFHANFV